MILLKILIPRVGIFKIDINMTSKSVNIVHHPNKFGVSSLENFAGLLISTDVKHSADMNVFKATPLLMTKRFNREEPENFIFQVFFFICHIKTDILKLIFIHKCELL